MKKVILLFGAVVIAICTAVGVQASVPSDCGVSACGGGETKCCEKDGATFFLTKPVQ
jgi:hypothetical protein